MAWRSSRRFDFFDRVQALIKILPEKIDEYQNLLTGNPIWISRLKGVGHLSAADAIALGVTGPPLRASGVDLDLRRDMPYSSYEKFQFKVPVSNDGDVWARYIVRLEEMRESVKICQQALDGMPEGPHQSRRAEGRPARPREDEDRRWKPSSITSRSSPKDSPFRPARSTRRSSRRAARWATTSSRDGTAKPYRVHMRNPTFATLQALQTMCEGRLIADVVAVIGSIDIVLGEIDR